uniref:Ig-like domain-containing protein n=1 Tax=Terrapene triunguis TaxID=2587831 RepID=A0A674KHH3_9SAUR
MLQIHVNFWFSFLVLFLDGCAQIHLKQAQLSITRAETKTARIDCEASGFNFNSAYIHWYRQSPGEAPKRILYIGSGSVSMDEGFNSKKFTASNDVSAFTANLRVDQLTLEDAATYYCATWDTTVVESHRHPVQKPTVHSEPQPFNKVRILPPFTEKDGKVTHVCLIEDFYPNVIKVTWDDDKKNVEKNAVLGEIWPPDDNRQSYSMSSWLTVDKNSNKNYRCSYQHEKDTVITHTACSLLKQTRIITKTKIKKIMQEKEKIN